MNKHEDEWPTGSLCTAPFKHQNALKNILGEWNAWPISRFPT
jgi:hypothetical protein